MAIPYTPTASARIDSSAPPTQGPSDGGAIPFTPGMPVPQSTAPTNASSHAKPQISIPDAQLVKQAAGQFGAWQYGKVDPDAKASEMVYNTFYNKLKTSIEDTAPEGVKEINQQLSRLIPVSNAIVRRIPVFERQAPLSLTDFIGLTASTFEPHALGLTILNFLSKNGMVANQLMQHSATAANTLAPYASLLTGDAASTLNLPTSLPQQQ